MAEYFLLSIKKMNMTIVFFQPSLDVPFEAAATEATKLTAGIADVLVGTIPLLPLVASGMSEKSILYMSDATKWSVPCPKPISMVDRFLTVFDASVWLTMIIVCVLTSALFWFSANYPGRMVEIESKNLQTIPKCMYSAWSIFIGVSFPEMPRSWKMRNFFLLYVCYCFAMSTLFYGFSYRILLNQKKITLQQFVPSLYTVSSGRTLQCANTNLSGCYILCTVCSNHIIILLLSTVFADSVIKQKMRKKKYINNNNARYM